MLHELYMKVAVTPQLSTMCYSMGYRESLGSGIKIPHLAFFTLHMGTSYVTVFALRIALHRALYVVKHQKSQVGDFNLTSKQFLTPNGVTHHAQLRGYGNFQINVI